ncbi:MAG: T9SS type A sorting domain-containing protein [Fimbriimonadaceae bacterium]|nr:T9SS type A sorting domain-containing protein [Chitinophagales bacterium]
MKKYTLPFIFIISTLKIFSQSPVTIEVNDIVDGGDSFIISTANPIGVFDIVTTGADITWDFSDLTPLQQDTIYWVDATDTDPSYFLLWFSSDIAEQFVQAFSTDSFSIEDVYNFYDRSADKFKQTGIAGTYLDIPIISSFDDDDIVLDFPVAYENIDSSTSGFSFDFLGLFSFTETRNRKNITDGWGTITTPYGTFNVVRLKSELQVEDVIESSGVEIPFSYASNEYKWLAKEMGVPVLQITTQVIAGTETVTRVAYQDSARIITGIQNVISEDDFLVYPNPATDRINISYSGSFITEIRIYDVSGKLIREYPYSNELNISDLEAGVYFVKLYSENKLIAQKKMIRVP